MSKEFSGYKVSQQTAAYIDALKSLHNAHNVLLKAIYEENRGESEQDDKEQKVIELIQDAKEQKVMELIDPLEVYIWEQIEQSVYDNLLTDANSTGDIL